MWQIVHDFACEGTSDPVAALDAINEVDFDNTNPYTALVDPTNVGTLRAELDNCHPIHTHKTWLFAIGDMQFFVTVEHFLDYPVRYFYELQEHKRHPSFGEPNVWYGDEVSYPCLDSSTEKEQQGLPSQEYRDDLEIFRPALEAPTAYFGTSSLRPSKPLPLEFGFFLGRLSCMKKEKWESVCRHVPTIFNGEVKYYSTIEPQDQESEFHNFQSTPFVVFVHPIDKSYWIVFDYLPITRRIVAPTYKRGKADFYRGRVPPKNVGNCEYCHEKVDLELFDADTWRVAPIERLEEMESFWKELGVPPFSVLRIPPLRWDDTLGDGRWCSRPDDADQPAPGKKEEEKGEEHEQEGHAVQNHGPFIEVALDKDPEEPQIRMLSQATRVRPNPFKAKHAEWKDYWSRWLWDPQPGDPSPSPTSPDRKDSTQRQDPESWSADNTCQLCAAKQRKRRTRGG